MNLIDSIDTPELRLGHMGVRLPKMAPTPIGNFCNVRKIGNMLFVSGQGPVQEDGTLLCGKVGRDVNPEDAREHAKLVAVNILATLRDNLGSLNSIAGAIKILGLVNATQDFTRHSYIIDGASEFLVDVFGPPGVHSRTSFGVASLPNNITVEIEAIFELRED